MDGQLKANNAWVVLMPAVVFGGSRDNGSYHAMRALERHAETDWRLVFLNNRQKVLVDITTPQGKKLFDGIVVTEETVYPDEYHRNLIRSHCWYLYRSGLEEKRQGFEYAKKALQVAKQPLMVDHAAGVWLWCRFWSQDSGMRAHWPGVRTGMGWPSRTGSSFLMSAGRRTQRVRGPPGRATASRSRPSSSIWS